MNPVVSHLRDQNFCCYCGKLICYPLKPTSEHLIPRSHGGNSTVYNTRACCDKCNTWRGNKSLRNWKMEIAERINNNIPRAPFYHVSDFKTMILNIDRIEVYIKTAGEKLYADYTKRGNVKKSKSPRPAKVCVLKTYIQTAGIDWDKWYSNQPQENFHQ